MSASVIILMSVAGAGLLLFSVVFCVALVRARRLAKQPAPPKPKCPRCGSERIDIATAGFWDGINTGGGIQYGTCRDCNTRCEHRSAWDDQSRQMRYTDRTLTDEQWRQEVEPSPEQMRIRQLQSQWPFIPEDQSHVNQGSGGES